MKKNACHAATSALSIHGPRVIGFDQHRQLHTRDNVTETVSLGSWGAQIEQFMYIDVASMYIHDILAAIE